MLGETVDRVEHLVAMQIEIEESNWGSSSLNQLGAGEGLGLVFCEQRYSKTATNDILGCPPLKGVLLLSLTFPS